MAKIRREKNNFVYMRRTINVCIVVYKNSRTDYRKEASRVLGVGVTLLVLTMQLRLVYLLLARQKKHVCMSMT